MKHASEIFRHLFQPALQSNIETHRCYRKFIAALPPKWQSAIAFVYIKERTLFIALRHPGYKMEFHYNRELLKSLLTQFAASYPACNIPKITQVTVFSSRYHTPSQEIPDTVPFYDEQAYGNFTLPADEELKKRFQSIRERIQCLKH
jgi:hypothetical protein